MTILHLLLSPIVGAVVGYLFFRWAARRSMVADLPDSYAWEAAYRSVSVRRDGDEVDEILAGRENEFHLEVMSQPYADDPPRERYAAVSVIYYGPEKVHVELSSIAPIRVVVLEPTEVACGRAKP